MVCDGGLGVRKQFTRVETRLFPQVAWLFLLRTEANDGCSSVNDSVCMVWIDPFRSGRVVEVGAFLVRDSVSCHRCEYLTSSGPWICSLGDIGFQPGRYAREQNEDS